MSVSEVVFAVAVLVLVCSIPLVAVLDILTQGRRDHSDQLARQVRALGRQMAIASEELANVRDGTSSPESATQTLERIRLIGTGTQNPQS